jgi:hypothetical protein
MKTGLLGIFTDYESAELARAVLLVSAFPIDRITLKTLPGPGRSTISPVAPGDKVLSSLRALFKPKRGSVAAEDRADLVECGAASVSACAHNPAAASRVARILKDCGATDVIEDEESMENCAAPSSDHEEAWRNYLSTAA